MLLFSLLACTDTTPLVQACQAVPALHVPEADRAPLLELLVAKEAEALGARETRGGKAVDWTALRNATLCTLDSKDDGTLTLTRTSPRITDDGGLGEEHTVSFTWELVDGKVRTGLLDAHAQLEGIPEDPIEAEAAWAALLEAYPDPSLAVDMAWARKEAFKARYVRDKVTLSGRMDGDKLMADIRNVGNRPLLEVHFVAEVQGREAHAFTRPEIPPDTDVTMVERASGATGLKEVRIDTFTLGEPLKDEPPTP